LPTAFTAANEVLLYEPSELEGIFTTVLHAVPYARKFTTVQHIIEFLVGQVQSGDHLLVMSNGSFENIHRRLLNALK
jgi:UDP-N-acetylmuramate: L-alanyl-gamma-D-glutamyl-meso-diaminopimelate ligase